MCVSSSIYDFYNNRRAWDNTMLSDFLVFFFLFCSKIADFSHTGLVLCSKHCSRYFFFCRFVL